MAGLFVFIACVPTTQQPPPGMADTCTSTIVRGLDAASGLPFVVGNDVVKVTRVPRPWHMGDGPGITPTVQSLTTFDFEYTVVSGPATGQGLACAVKVEKSALTRPVRHVDMECHGTGADPTVRLTLATAANGDLGGTARDEHGQVTLGQMPQRGIPAEGFTLTIGMEVVGAVSPSGRPTVWKCASTQDALVTHALAALVLYSSTMHL